MLLSSYIGLLEDHREKHGGKKKNKSDCGKNLTIEERIFLIYEDAKIFYKEFHNGPCIVERYVDFNSILDYQLDECFDFIHLKEFTSERIPYYPNLVTMFFANLRIKKNPLILFSLVKRTMIILGELELGEILCISATRQRIFGKTFSSFGWNRSEALLCFLGLELMKSLKLRIFSPLKFRILFSLIVSPPERIYWQR